MKKLLFVVALGFTSFIASAQSSKISVIQGQKFQAVSTMKMDMSIEAQGQQMEIPITMNSTSSIVVDAVSDASITIKATTTKIKSSMNMMGKDMGADSDVKEDLEKEENKPVFSNLNKEVIFDYNVKTGESVKRKDVKGEDEAAAGMSQMAGGNETTYFLLLPENLKVNDTWKKAKKDDKGTTEKTYTITKLEGNLATITLSGTADLNFQTSQMGMEMTVSQKGTSKGTLVVNITNNMVISDESTTEMNGAMEMQGMSMPQTIKIVSTYAVTEVK